MRLVTGTADGNTPFFAKVSVSVAVGTLALLLSTTFSPSPPPHIPPHPDPTAGWQVLSATIPNDEVDGTSRWILEIWDGEHKASRLA